MVRIFTRVVHGWIAIEIYYRVVCDIQDHSFVFTYEFLTLVAILYIKTKIVSCLNAIS